MLKSLNLNLCSSIRETNHGPGRINLFIPSGNKSHICRKLFFFKIVSHRLFRLYIVNRDEMTINERSMNG